MSSADVLVSLVIDLAKKSNSANFAPKKMPLAHRSPTKRCRDLIPLPKGFQRRVVGFLYLISTFCGRMSLQRGSLNALPSRLQTP